MKSLFVALIILISIIFQAVYGKSLELFGITPNFYVILVVCFALLGGSQKGSIIGFFLGLLQDIFFGDIFGLNALIGMYIGFLYGKASKNLNKDNSLVAFLMGISAIFIYDIILYMFKYLIYGNINIIHFLNHIIIPEIIYSSIFIFVFYKGLYFIDKKLDS